MNVKAILAAKRQGGDTIGIEPTATLAAAAKLLVKHHIGALVTLRVHLRILVTGLAAPVRFTPALIGE